MRIKKDSEMTLMAELERASEKYEIVLAEILSIVSKK